MIGIGYDSHRLKKGHPLIIGGVHIESEFGAVSHSDGDALLHALCDALLGAAGLGDIGEHFPDNDTKYKDTESKHFVNVVVKMLKEKKYEIVNIDSSVILETPKLKAFKESIRKNIATLCKIPIERVNVKAKTNEKIGFIGRSEGIAAFCVCQLQKKNSDVHK